MKMIRYNLLSEQKKNGSPEFMYLSLESIIVEELCRQG